MANLYTVSPVYVAVSLHTPILLITATNPLGVRSNVCVILPFPVLRSMLFSLMEIF